MKTCHFSEDKEVQSHQVHQEGYVDDFLGQQRSNPHRLPAPRNHNEWEILR